MAAPLCGRFPRLYDHAPSPPRPTPGPPARHSCSWSLRCLTSAPPTGWTTGWTLRQGKNPDEPRELCVFVGVVVHDRRGGGAAAPQRDCDVYVRRVDAERGEPGVRRVLPHARPSGRSSGGVLHHGGRRV